jgi:hypothetical protein
VTLWQRPNRCCSAALLLYCGGGGCCCGCCSSCLLRLLLLPLLCFLLLLLLTRFRLCSLRRLPRCWLVSLVALLLLAFCLPAPRAFDSVEMFGSLLRARVLCWLRPSLYIQSISRPLNRTNSFNTGCCNFNALQHAARSLDDALHSNDIQHV